MKQTISAVRPAGPEPKFRLVATSYYRSKPEKSMALVSEPGSGFRWVKQGARLGYFVVENVKRGMIVYRDGDRLREMAVNTKVSVPTALVRQTALASGQTSTSPSRPSIPHKPRMTTHNLLHKLGLQRPEARPIAYDREREGW